MSNLMGDGGLPRLRFLITKTEETIMKTSAQRRHEKVGKRLESIRQVNPEKFQQALDLRIKSWATVALNRARSLHGRRCFALVQEQLEDLLRHLALTSAQKQEAKVRFEQFCAHAVAQAVDPRLAPTCNFGRCQA